uniref:Uncharacterized protein n=1 Tax=Coturnix japonica TaxID=93934 RepID=A0A8C2STP0_COTJA
MRSFSYQQLSEHTLWICPSWKSLLSFFPEAVYVLSQFITRRKCMSNSTDLLLTHMLHSKSKRAVKIWENKFPVTCPDFFQS